MEHVSVKQWGNSQGIRIPKDILEKLDIHVADVLQLDIEDNAIILKKPFKHKSFFRIIALKNGSRNIMERFLYVILTGENPWEGKCYE